MDEIVQANRDSIDAGFDAAPPELEGVRGVMMLVDRDNARGMGITLFETREELDRGHAALDAMTPPVPDAGGRRESVEFYEVSIQRDRTTTPSG